MGTPDTDLLVGQASLTPTPVDELHTVLEVSKSMGAPVTYLLVGQASLPPTPVDELHTMLEVSK